MFYQLQISGLCWCVELGWVDIIAEVLTLSSHLAFHVRDVWNHCSICLVISIRSTMRESSLTHRIQLLIWLYSRNVIGSISMAICMKQFCLTHLFHEEWTLMIYECLTILTMRAITWCNDCTQAFWYIWIWPWSHGIQRSKWRSRPGYLAQNPLQWSKAWRLCKACVTIFEWWE
jgi:hypothetical protein